MPAPNAREWIRYDVTDGIGEPFIVLSYNILSDRLATAQMYGYCPTWALNWDTRRDEILKEIRDADADLICLQEVEAGQFDDFFMHHLGEHYRLGEHYDGVFLAEIAC